MSSHKLFLSVYTFVLKRSGTSNKKTVLNDDFLDEAYPNIDNKFVEGFAQDIIKSIDKSTFKNKSKTHGGILESKSIGSKSRTIDLMIDGGLTGIQQFIIDENGNKEVLGKEKTVGLKFFIRLWMPSNSDTGFVFMQKYNGLSIKPLIDSLILDLIKEKKFNVVGNKLNRTTTKKRQRLFLKHAMIRDISIISRNKFSTEGARAKSATLKLSGVSLKELAKDNIESMAKEHGFSLSDREYQIKATYLCNEFDTTEEKTIPLNDEDGGINLIPNILIGDENIDAYGYPVFEKMQVFVDREISQIQKEAKL